MPNQYLRNLNRIEYLVTYACTGRCKHCSLGEDLPRGAHIDGKTAAHAVREIAGEYGIASVMTFGGEPLLFAADVREIHAAAREAGVEKRQIITNGFFTRDISQIERTAKSLVDSGVNEVLLSVDAFHQERIPLDYVVTFARELLKSGIDELRTHPAWLVCADASNFYNDKTREILKVFENIGVGSSHGNVIFPSGNALKYLREYFDLSETARNPYKSDPFDVRRVCFSPDGSLFGGDNIYETGALAILENYAPEKVETTANNLI